MMTFEETETRLLEEIKTTADMMYEVGDDEKVAFEQVDERIASLPNEVRQRILTLALMTLSANAMVKNEEIQNAAILRSN